MQTKQPRWKQIGSIGDLDPIAHGGGFVYEDQTGVYAPEMSYFEPLDDGTWERMHGCTPLTVYRILIERDAEREWWYGKLDAVASYIGQTEAECKRMASGATMERACIYEALISYFGAHEFDSYPTRTTEGKAYFRYWREMRRRGAGTAAAESEAADHA